MAHIQTAWRFNNVPYIRVSLQKGGNFDPYIGQIAFFRRRQLSHAPWNPFDFTNQHGRVDSFESSGGVFYDTVRYLGRRELGTLVEPLSG